MSENLQTDVLVIGWGKGGKSLARALGSAGRDVVLVERTSHMHGGSCINVACVPTKALISSANHRRKSDEPREYFTGAVDVDAQEVINLIAMAMRTGITASQLRDGIWTHPSSTEALNEVLTTLH